VDGQVGFWIAAAVMVAMVALVLVQAIRHGRAQALAAPGSEDVAVYRDQLAEVDRDLARGTLAPAEAARLRAEISRRLLAADARRSATAPTRAMGTGLGLLAVVLALAGAVALYAQLGVPTYGDLPLSRRLALSDEAMRNRPDQAAAEAAAPKMQAAPQVDPQLMELIQQLRQVVKDHPDDPRGLQFLAKYEGMLGNFQAAVTAQTHLIAVRGDQATAEDHASLAELMILAAGGVVTPQAEAELKAALTKDPKDAPARYYSGLMFLQVGRPDRTFELWKPLLDEGPADAPWIGPIRDQIEDIAAAAGIRYQLPAAKGPSAQDMAAAAQMSPEDRQTMIEGMVGGLETRLMADGGPVEDWAKLINALGVLGQTDRARAAYDRARAAFADQPGALSALQAAASQAGLTP
jgi:cytochrome c-type biogenesis protein CcmH